MKIRSWVWAVGYTLYLLLVASIVYATPSWESNIKDPAVRDFREAVYSVLWDNAEYIAKLQKHTAQLEKRLQVLEKRLNIQPKAQMPETHGAVARIH